MKKLLMVLAVVGVMLALSGTAGASVSGVLWGSGSPAFSVDASGPSGVIYQFDTGTGTISKTFEFSGADWMWVTGVADSGDYLYATHNKYGYGVDPDLSLDLKVAKIDRDTGAILSDTSIAGYLGQSRSQVNALDFHDGKLYGVENATSGSTIRGYAIEIGMNGSGDVVGATKGAFVGSYPDAGLDFHDGLWYATSWGYPGGGSEQGSLVYTSPDIMNTAFTELGTGVTGMGMIDGWEFDGDHLFAVSWYGADYSNTSVYDIDTSVKQWTATALYDLSSQLPSHITDLNGLSNVIPEPASLIVWSLLIGITWAGGAWRHFYRRRRQP